MNAVRLYGRYVSISLRSQLTYRLSLVLQTIGQFSLTGIEFLGIWAMFTRFGSVRGWTLHEVAFFYALVSISWGLADSLVRGFDAFGATVRYGEFDRVLLRPRSTVLQLFGQELSLRRVGRLAQGMAVLAFALGGLDIAWSAGRLLLLVGAVLGGACVFIGLVVLQATSAFWATESLEVWNAFTYGGVSMSQYPLEIYRPWFRRFFTVVIPLGSVNYFPAVAILGRPDPLGSPVALQWLAWLAGPLFLAVCFGLWQVGVSHYQSTGS